MLQKQRDLVKDLLSGKYIYKSAFENVLKEIDIMNQLDHQNIIKLYEVINDEEDDKLYMSNKFHLEIN